MQEDSSKVSAPAAAGGRKPVILAVDDEPQVLNAVALDLRRRFRADYRILTAASGAEGLDAIRKLRQRGDLVALFLVDQRMPAMTGVEFLNEARKVHPEAKKVLLTAYADTEAAIASINQVDLDHYLMKPWHPPEQKLYPVIGELLDAWARVVRAPWDGIRVVGTLWSSGSHEAKDFLARNRIPTAGSTSTAMRKRALSRRASPLTRASCRCCSSLTVPYCRRRRAGTSPRSAACARRPPRSSTTWS